MHIFLQASVKTRMAWTMLLTLAKSAAVSISARISRVVYTHNCWDCNADQCQLHAVLKRAIVAQTRNYCIHKATGNVLGLGIHLELIHLARVCGRCKSQKQQQSNTNDKTAGRPFMQQQSTVEITKFLVVKGIADVNARNENGTTKLYEAVS